MTETHLAPKMAPKVAGSDGKHGDKSGRPGAINPRFSGGFIDFSGQIWKGGLERVKGIEPSS